MSTYGTGMTETKTADLSRFLTTEEFAELMRRPPSTIRYWRHLGVGPVGLRFGRRVLYPRDVVEAWLAEQQRAANVPPHR